MDADLFKIVALISGILAILDKLYVYSKSAYQALRKSYIWTHRRLAYTENLRLTLTRDNKICNSGVVEIPLDIDFHTFLSPIPPIENLCQRIGRLNRFNSSVL